MTICFFTSIPCTNTLLVLEMAFVVTAFVCLAVYPQPLFYTLIIMIGPWQQDTVQLHERKWASLKFPPLNCSTDHCSGTNMEPALKQHKWYGLIMVMLCVNVGVKSCWNWIFMTWFFMNILLCRVWRQLLKLYWKGLPRDHREKRKRKGISKINGRVRRVGMHRLNLEVTLRAGLTYF